MARRVEIAKEIGLTKQKDGSRVRDPSREEAVRSSFAKTGKKLDLDPSIAARIADLLISESIKVQRSKNKLPLKGKSAVVIGGAGRMGEWTCRFLSNRGAEVAVWDERGRLRGYENLNDPEERASKADFVAIAGPLGKSRDDLVTALDSEPIGVVFDLCSVKHQIADQLRSACSDGFLVTSVHPMFGPSAPSPKDRNVLVCDCGSQTANKRVAKLFRDAGANVSVLGLDQHDELIAYVLGLSHLCTLLFAESVVVSGKSLGQLSDVKGPSFEKLVKMARELSVESKRVYHDIQHLNPHTRRLIATMEMALGELKAASLDENPAAFGRIMESSRRALEVS